MTSDFSLVACNNRPTSLQTSLAILAIPSFQFACRFPSARCVCVCVCAVSAALQHSFSLKQKANSLDPLNSHCQFAISALLFCVCECVLAADRFRFTIHVLTVFKATILKSLTIFIQINNNNCSHWESKRLVIDSQVQGARLIRLDRHLSNRVFHFFFVCLSNLANLL